MLAIVAAGSAFSQSHSSFIALSQFSQWVPGKPNKIQQYRWEADGSGQFAELLNDKVVRVASFSTESFQTRGTDLHSFFKLNDHYEIPATLGLRIEGRGDKSVLVVHVDGKTKHISADKVRLPPELAGLVNHLPQIQNGYSGSFMSVRLMPANFQLTTEALARLPVIVSDLQDQFPELKEAIQAPFKFIDMSPLQWTRLLHALRISAQAPYAQTSLGQIVKLEFFP